MLNWQLKIDLLGSVSLHPTYNFLSQPITHPLNPLQNPLLTMSDKNEKVFIGPTVSMLLMGDYDINLRKPVRKKQKYAGISVVVPTFKRVDLCQRLLASLKQSELYLQAPVEIIFVDNSPMPEAEQIHALCMEYGAKYYLKKISVSAKRNFGAQIASYSIVLFVDSDCEASPQLLLEHLESY
jgi:hypothetical protein